MKPETNKTKLTNFSIKGGSDAWASSWPTGSSTGNLWTPIDGVAGERGTPSNLSTFLPENLLGTELN